MERMEELVDKEQFDDSHALWEEFVVDTEEPDEWIFVEYISETLNEDCLSLEVLGLLLTTSFPVFWKKLIGISSLRSTGLQW